MTQSGMLSLRPSAHSVASCHAVAKRHSADDWIGRMVRDIMRGHCVARRAVSADEPSAPAVSAKAPPPARKPRISMVYFVQSVTGGPIKIGKTTNIANRLSSMQTANGAKLRLLGWIPGSYGEERDMHARFQRERMIGEWFAPSKRLLGYIADVCIKPTA